MCRRKDCSLPQRAHNCPTVAARVNLELVGVGILESLTVSQPEHIRRVLLFAPCALQGAVHRDRFAQGGDDGGRTPLKLQFFD